MDIKSPAIKGFRLIVFLLAIGYWIYQFTQNSFDSFGWQFRYLTIWGLTGYMIVAWLMLRMSLGRSNKGYNSLVTATAILGVMVLFLYWKLWFTDPSLVNSSGPIPWHQEYYLHLAGPVLMMIDAFFILGIYHRVARAYLLTMVIFLAYIGWIENFVRPLNMFPEGSATNGLPYPFLNDMTGKERVSFYVTTLITATVFFALGWGLALLLRRFRRG